jgi:hypothetical protein
MSCIECQVWFANFWLLPLNIFRWRKARGKAWFLSYFVLDKWLRILPKAYLISGMKYYCLYHIILTSIYPIISFILLLLWQLKFEFARARIHTFYIEIISFHCRQILVKTNNSTLNKHIMVRYRIALVWQNPKACLKPHTI